MTATLIKLGDKEFTPAELAILAKAGALQIGTKNDPASTTLPAAQLHGPLATGTGYGPLSVPGIRPQMLSAMSHPKSLLDVLPMMMSEVATEKIDIMTGVTTEGGTNATGLCGNPPANGALKKCKQSYTFGSYYIKTDLIALANVGLLEDRADMPRDILNAGPQSSPLVPETAFLNDTRSEFRYQLYLVGVAAERDWSHVSIQGNNALASTATQHGWIQEFTGIDSQVKTGYTDASTSLACPAADSIVDSFNVDISATDASSRSFTEAMQDLAYAVMDRAETFGMMGVEWAIVMRREAFYRAAQEIAFNGPTARGGVLDNGTLFVNPAETVRQDLLRRRVLPLNGFEWPVVIDDGIPQETLANQTYKSDIYFIPLRWAGMPLTYLQYFNMGNQYSMEFSDAYGMSEARRLNNGLWLVGKRDTGLCVEYHFQAKARAILEAPFLAARLDDVQYRYLPKTRNPIPGASLYADGGASYVVTR